MPVNSHPFLQWSLCWAILCSLSAAVFADEPGQDDSKLLSYIQCAVDFDMFGKILGGTAEEDKIRLFGEEVMDLEDQSKSFFRNGSDFFAIKAIKLSSNEQVLAIARDRFESIAAGFETNHQAQFNEILSSGYMCYALLNAELLTVNNDEDGH